MLGFSSTPPARPMNADDWQKQASFAGERDSADRLPTVARAKLRALRSELAEARAVVSVPREALDVARDRLRKCDLHLDMLRRQGMTESHPATVAETEVCARLAGEVKDASDDYARRQAAVAPLGGMLRRLEAYVASLPQTGVAIAPAVSPRLAKGETPLQALDRVREQIIAAADAAQAVIDAPIPSADVKRAMRKQVAALAASAAPDVQVAVDFAEPVKFPTSPFDVFIAHDNRRGTADVPNPVALCAWLFRDQLIARLDAEIDNAADDTAALDDASRSKKLAAALAQKLMAEREEEALVEMIRATGVSISRRPGADVRAVLGIEGPEPRED